MIKHYFSMEYMSCLKLLYERSFQALTNETVEEFILKSNTFI